MVNIHPSDSAGFTPRAQAICLLVNSYKFLNPKATFREIGEALGISETNAFRYYYGIHSVNEAWSGKGCYQRCRRGACTPIMDKAFAESALKARGALGLSYSF